MSDIELMQQMLERAITRITELEEKIKEIKNNPAAILELRESKKLLAVQQRVKITLTQSIQELRPTSDALIIPMKQEAAGSFLMRMGNMFKNLFKSSKIEIASQ
jgi:HD superfamily phosphohydrolase